MPYKPRLPASLRQEIGYDDHKRRMKRPQIQAPRKKRKLYQAEPAIVDEPHRAERSKPKQPVPKTAEEILIDKDDLEIDYWEAKLGHATKTNADDYEDGLDDLLDGLDLPRGQSRLEEVTEDAESGSEGHIAAFEEEDGEASSPEDDFTNFPDESEDIPRPSIYLPFQSTTQSTREDPPQTKYIPPALRNKQSDETNIRRQLNG